MGGAREMRRTVLAAGRHGSFKGSEPEFGMQDKGGVDSVLVSMKLGQVDTVCCCWWVMFWRDCL